MTTTAETIAVTEHLREDKTMNHELIQLTPYDNHSQELEANVHPPGWKNPTPTQPYHLVVIGAENAGDMISEITVAMTNKVGLSGIGGSIHPYPTQAEAIRKLGDQINRTKLTPMAKKILNLLRRLNVGA